MLEQIIKYIIGILSPPLAYLIYCAIQTTLAKTFKKSIMLILQNTVKIIMFNIISLGIVHLTAFFGVEKLKGICSISTFTMILIGEFVYLVLLPLFLDMIKINISSILFLAKVKEFTPLGVLSAFLKSSVNKNKKSNNVFDENMKTEDLEALLNSNDTQIKKLKEIVLQQEVTKKVKNPLKNTDDEITDPSILPVYANVNDSTTTQEVKKKKDNNTHNDI